MMRLVMFTLMLLMGSAAARETIHVAAASSLRPPLEVIVKDFEHHHPQYQVHVSYAASGKLVAQVQHGAPYALLLVAEPAYLTELWQRQLLLSEPQHFSYGQLVLWHPQQQGTTVDLIRNAERIALAQPRHAPYGKAAQTYLNNQFPATDFSGQLVFGENVAQAAHRVYAGAVPIGFVALSQLLQLQVPATDYTLLPEVEPLPQAMALTLKAETLSGARLLQSFLLAQPAQAAFNQYGYLSHAASE
ncbi:molybdate ABC transporter substrate-binding protein [Pseudidiomarina terrestris]|uniref:Molybdate ABC transporter substrate-binding protein n=1 Tax=Pseudidiomarina terrestris TaxID=2820060 RepID=A0AAW7QYC3_9GAMM|nr:MULTISPECIES: molybdate ABC transporter substrate-binding protein [unclassified Pseudidiomarina]MDN7124739.1 molybdate ABC transporter substrate-binding protein [Pseudidiomarina sp. 1APP75-32.1]MDN7129787.1 molybdate ABC transporter substrate-binding protein [Pseudidiomarina sp. 1APR75-15]MDN7136436.1 molybdate ABC transporter substrate-binding protein [Pseudidiomarina sp. 1ASP75-5]